MRRRLKGYGLALAAVTTTLGSAPALAPAQGPIPQTPLAKAPAFTGTAATPNPVAAPEPPRHPHMAANGRSNLHSDAYQTDTNTGFGPLGRELSVTSSFRARECASVTFDRRGRIVTVCVGLERTTLELLDPKTLQTLAEMQLPARDLTQAGGLNVFQNFTGGGYFYLDDQDRAVIPTASRHLFVVALDDQQRWEIVRDVDLTSAVPSGDAIISALPDWAGRIWFASRSGVVGVLSRDGTIKTLDLQEPIGNSFAVDETGGVFIVSDKAMYRFDAGPDGVPRATWAEPYQNTGGDPKPGQSQAGSGTTPTLIGEDLVAITDNADPINVVVYRRGAQPPEGGAPRKTCEQPVFTKGASSTDQSLIATPELIIVENNHGYTGPAAVEGGRTTTPGLTRIDLNPDGTCSLGWTSQETAPSVVPKLSLASGLVYTYTKEARSDGDDSWYLTTIDVRTGKTVYKALAGEGLGFNNNYAPVTLGPDGTAYVGVLGGLVALRDGVPLPEPDLASRPPAQRAARLVFRCERDGVVRAEVKGSAVRRVRFRLGGRFRADDRRAPFAIATRAKPGTTVTAAATLRTKRVLTSTRRVPRCGR
ncbi:hypothetical protein [Paraconexibacter sp.]|uniref:hypothetical protein n=1 Tax=Paraconexibacter sp. TaxID=2949640 RepID=UPI0035630ECA